MSRSERNWTIVTIFYRDPVPVDHLHPGGWKHRREKYVIYEPLKAEADKIVERWLHEDSSRRVNLHSINYYPRNYVDMERDLRAQGRVIG